MAVWERYGILNSVHQFDAHPFQIQFQPIAASAASPDIDIILGMAFCKCLDSHYVLTLLMNPLISEKRLSFG